MGKITVNAIGGLANRMRSICAGIALAERLGYEVEIVWGINSDLYAPYNELFMITSVTPMIREIRSPLKYALTYELPRRKNLYLSSLYQKAAFSTVISDSFVQYADNQRVSFLSRVEGRGDMLISSGQTFYPFDAELFRSIFVPTDEIMERVRANCSRPGNMYGLHVRRTDNIESIKASPLEGFKRKIDSVLAADPTAWFYLASDSQDVKRELAETYGDKIVYNSAPASRNTVSGIKDAMVDLYTLASAAKVFGSFYSSFSDAVVLISPLCHLEVVTA